MKAKDLSIIKLLVLDVDGVLTDGGIIIHSDGTESKRFHVMDGHRIKMWHRAGGLSAIISGRQSEATSLRAGQLDISHVMQGCLQKLSALEQLMQTTGLALDQIACIGDDVVDIPLIRRVGFGAAVANAAEELKKNADFVTQRSGGDGAVGEVIEYLLKNNHKWDALMERYLI